MIWVNFWSQLIEIEVLSKCIFQYFFYYLSYQSKRKKSISMFIIDFSLPSLAPTLFYFRFNGLYYRLCTNKCKWIWRFCIHLNSSFLWKFLDFNSFVDRDIVDDETSSIFTFLRYLIFQLQEPIKKMDKNLSSKCLFVCHYPIYVFSKTSKVKYMK